MVVSELVALQRDVLGSLTVHRLGAHSAATAAHLIELGTLCGLRLLGVEGHRGGAARRLLGGAILWQFPLACLQHGGHHVLWQRWDCCGVLVCGGGGHSGGLLVGGGLGLRRFCGSGCGCLRLGLGSGVRQEGLVPNKGGGHARDLETMHLLVLHPASVVRGLVHQVAMRQRCSSAAGGHGVSQVRRCNFGEIQRCAAAIQAC
mmetsp:Transcript_147024/g.382147  ORF Transcript_147024/g.382147 Transcript_147024/m.382147 type:complete len:203 (-) Transcript_147024:268-876(-)